ncbi:uncharacterized protein FA14DRAFT_156754 [Meira miltonrushii]|uniref:C2H2-type domain-containing protein n=1 Tax=Meira miltonrushii TaxID=1280837 RepID=A0A316VF26_9BASI|nr:uncharacterized protein FA14DRAFT_156754 [Meira miltonrushii]PWN34085.1 hypothetical protein FA14DRAFT_156754 [Meira miltonrushii]
MSTGMPMKGFFHSTPSQSPPAATATNINGVSAARSALNGSVTDNGDSTAAASIPSSVPKNGRRRESISSQMRKLVSESPALAAGGGGGGLSFHRSVGNSISPRLSASQKIGDSSALSTSLGSAAEFLSTSAKTVSGANGGNENGVKAERAGHTHFGQECYVPVSPEKAGSNEDSASSTARARRGSFSSVTTDDDKKEGGIHRCEACSKVYRHPSCLIKHRWEHTVYWKEASKFLMSKHQQVQLLEAAAILVGMDTHARSLPEEKALWPAAVSPPASGLLGSDRINFEKLLAQKSARKSQSPMVERKEVDGSSNVENGNGTIAHSMPTHSASLSPLNNFTSLNLGRYSSSRNNDINGFRLDESAERSVREESLESEEDEEDRDFDDMNEGDESMTGSTSISTGSPSREAEERERYGAGAGGDVLAELEMEGVE